MKKYTFTYSGTFGNGTKTIEANTKKEAIAKAKEKYPFHGVNTSSFKLAK